jgi:hypothetical protein
MELPTPDPALQAANLALQGRRAPRAASRFASIELRDVASNVVRERRSMAWEMAAVLAVGIAALLAVAGLWLY